MATYEYRCPKCDKVFERFGVPMSEFDEDARCPECGTSSKRVMSKPGLIII